MTGAPEYYTDWHDSDYGRFVYFIAPIGGGLIKIGCSQTPRKRLGELLSWSPTPLEILAHVPGNFFDERKLHAMFVGHHSHSEWFRPAPELLELIDRIRATGELPAECRGTRHQPCLSRPKHTPETRAKQSAAMKRAWQKAPWRPGRRKQMASA